MFIWLRFEKTSLHVSHVDMFQVGVKEAFKMYEEDFHAKMVKKIAAVDDLPPSLFSLFLDRVYKRKS